MINGIRITRRISNNLYDMLFFKVICMSLG